MKAKSVEEMTAQEYIEQRNKKFRKTVEKKYGKDHWENAGKAGAEKRWAKHRKQLKQEKILNKEKV